LGDITTFYEHIVLEALWNLSLRSACVIDEVFFSPSPAKKAYFSL